MYYIVELHNPSSTAISKSGVLLHGETTFSYVEKVAITPSTYSSIFRKPGQGRRRLAILKITFEDTQSKCHSIWRAANTKGITGITNDAIGLPFEAIWELDATGIKNAQVSVKRGCWFPFYYYHPNHAARIATRLGVISILLALTSIIISVIALCA